MSAETERAPAAITTDARGGVNTSSETVIYGLNGCGRITFGEPAPIQAEPKADNRPSWLKTMRQKGKPRWKLNGRSSR